MSTHGNPNGSAPRHVGTARTRPHDDGLSLVELLVVVLIVLLLAAIAVPAFLRQREQGYEAQATSGLKHAATALESYASSRNGDFSNATIPVLESDEGLRVAAGVDVTLPAGELTRTAYCLEATHSSAPGQTWHLAKSDGAPERGSC